MEFLSELLLPGNTSLAATLVLLSFVIAVGIYLGKIRFWGVSLGVTFVLFVGILMGHFGYEIQPEVLKFVREFGLILFIFAIGLQVGPGFFSSFKKGGIRLNMLAVLGILLNVAIVVAIYFIDGKTSISALVGVMSGAVTNTPGLAAAQQAAPSPEDVNLMSMGYAAAYPLGVLGIILSILITKAIFRVKIEDEIDEIQPRDRGGTGETPSGKLRGGEHSCRRQDTPSAPSQDTAISWYPDLWTKGATSSSPNRAPRYM